MKLYPICLKLDHLPCLVVGGGNVASRKTKALLDCGASVTVVSPRLCRALHVLRRKKAFIYEQSRYKKQILRKKLIVVAATDDDRINTQIAHDCRSAGKLVNVVDNPQLCNFFVPSVIRKAPLLVCISTQGTFPGMAKDMRKELTPYVQTCAREVRSFFPLRLQIKKRYGDKRTRKTMINQLLRSKRNKGEARR